MFYPVFYKTRHFPVINTMASHSNSHGKLYGAAKLCQDIATLINNPQGSDVQFKVGGCVTPQGNGETIYNESATVTFYAHSLILRCRSSYFITLLDEDKDWKERSKCVIYKPNILPTTFQDVLHYIYTGNVRAKNSENIIELIAVANEMGLEELGTKCESEFIRIVKHIFSDKDERRIPADIAIRTHIIPALNLADNHSLSHLSQKLLTIMLPRISIIIKSPDTYTTFISGISSGALFKIIKSDDLIMAERNIWDLALGWACCQTKISKTTVEAYLSNSCDDDEKSLNGAIIDNAQLNQLKKTLTPLLPAIRFSLFGFEDYKHMVNILNYFLPRRRYLEIVQFFLNPDGTGLLDVPRRKTVEQIMLSKIVVVSKIVAESTTWELLRKNIFETGGITGCHSLYHLKFELLFRASEHGFLASSFHQRCDNKGPTLVIIRSADEYIFGGVNFNPWKSDISCSSSTLNFLFTLPDRHRPNYSAIFRTDRSKAQFSSYNHHIWGPCFGWSDLVIADSANINQDSYSSLPSSYNGPNASDTSLAGSHFFTISDYEVFVISKL